MKRRVLALDVGNTRIKWALGGISGWDEEGVAALGEPEELYLAWDRMPAPERVIGSNVAAPKISGDLTDYWHGREVAVNWIQSTLKSCGVHNCYGEPEQLGTDRWAALIAAQSMRLGDCLVISLGTAMTIDWLRADGNFAGGMIIPGIRLMRETLARGTSQIGYQAGKVAGFSCNTADAVESGLTCALTGAVKAARQKVIDSSGAIPSCLISGGDGAWLAAMLDFPAKHVPDLVLKGLALMANRDE